MSERTQKAASTLAVITGMSGAGKSTALHALEDLSFYCVDNLPIPLIGPTLSVCAAGGLTRVALGIDVRVRTFLEEASQVLDAIGQRHERDVHVLFLDASDEALLRRYSETRRPHPLSTVEGYEGTALAVLEGIEIERERLAPLRARATYILDTTSCSVHELRRQIVAALGPAKSGGIGRMSTRLVSFGFKYGIPMDADVVLDVRFLDNPYFVPHLRELPGTHPDVRGYVLKNPEALEFLHHAQELLRFTLPRYEREGKAYLTIAIGCTGGKHRSVVLAEELASGLQATTELPPRVVHRDVARGHSDTTQRTEERDMLGGGARGKGST